MKEARKMGIATYYKSSSVFFNASRVIAFVSK